MQPIDDTNFFFFNIMAPSTQRPASPDQFLICQGYELLLGEYLRQYSQVPSQRQLLCIACERLSDSGYLVCYLLN